MSETTTQDWRTLPAGRALDALVATRVMGWVNVIESNPPNRTWPSRTRRHWRAPGSVFARKLPHYSTDIAAAWEVVRALRDPTEGDERFWTLTDSGSLGWHADLSWNAKEGDALVPLGEGIGDTAPLAICRAALTAMETP